MDVSTLLVFGLMLAGMELALGAVIGYWLRGRREPAPATQSPGAVTPQNQLALLQDVRARNALENLQMLTASVAAQVGEHNSQVQSINAELTSQQERGDDLSNTVFASMAKLLQANEALNEQLKSAENRLVEQKLQLEAREADALTDPLTGRANRRAFDNELERRLIEFNRRQTPVTLLMIDVDHFKKFNDTHGHQAGDEVLRGVGQTLFRSCRDMDLVCRYGGEEFGVIMPVTTLEQSKIAVERARKAIESALYKFENKELKVTISQGVAQSQASDTPAALIKRADEALYAAKKNGRNRAYVQQAGECTPLLLEPKPAAKPATPPPTTTGGAETESSFDTSGDTDPQTGVSSRTVFNLDVRRRVAEAKRYGSALSAMVVSVDELATYGTEHGDSAKALVMRTVAQFLSAAIREMDSVARFSEDSFAVLLPGTQLTNATAIAERLRGSIGLKALKIPTGELHLTVSVGVAVVEEEDDSDSLTKRASDAAKAARASGQNRTHVSRNGKCAPLDIALAT